MTNISGTVRDAHRNGSDIVTDINHQLTRQDSVLEIWIY
jgi:hypothetical protein